MTKDKVVELVQGKPAKEDVKKALCKVVVTRLNNVDVVYEDVAGYQLLENTLIILIHNGPTYLVPTASFAEVEIVANKE